MGELAPPLRPYWASHYADRSTVPSFQLFDTASPHRRINTQVGASDTDIGPGLANKLPALSFDR